MTLSLAMVSPFPYQKFYLYNEMHIFFSLSEKMSSICSICNDKVIDGENTVELGEKGTVCINNASNERNHTLNVDIGNVVHKTC